MEKQLLKEKNGRVFLGFWIYLMTDLLMFSVLFAAYAVLRESTYGSVSIHEIFDPPFVLAETIILLTSSFTSGLAVLFFQRKNKRVGLAFLITTLFFGITFLIMELHEFGSLLSEGNGPDKSAFLSSFFTLVGFHGLHIAGGSFWILLMTIQIIRKGLTDSNFRKVTLAGLFWHFLDVVWIFIFTIVYLMGGVL